MTSDQRHDHPDHSPDKTPDGRFIVVGGRRWRATDPSIPDDVASRLQHRLMDARRAVKAALNSDDETAERVARDEVQRIKVALGERGTPWWEQTEAERKIRWASSLD